MFADLIKYFICVFQMAPSIYMATAVEVVRRRAFSEQYLKKATSIADTFCTLHDEELSLRMNFQVMNILIMAFGT